MALVTGFDGFVLARRLLEKSSLSLIKRLLSGSRDRIQLTWERVEPQARNWYEIPQVQERIRKKITHSETLDVPSFVAQSYLRSGDLDALSLGCGAGGREILWAKTGRFKSIQAIDVSPSRIARAQETARREGVDGIVKFQCVDIFDATFGDETADVILAEGILHHLSPLESAIGIIHRALKPGGLVVANEYIGPDRFQWTWDQVHISNIALSRLPRRLRAYRQRPLIKRSIGRHGTLSMKLYDPSEAVESSRIVECLEKRFAILLRRDYGGTILHPLLKDIAHNFLISDPEADAALQSLFIVEDFMLSHQLLKSDFTFIVAQKK